jgi:thymidylate synthase
LIAKEFVYYLGNAHIYDDHINELKKQVERKPYPLPTINIKNAHKNIEDYTIDDIELIDYTSHTSIKMDMRK